MTTGKLEVFFPRIEGEKGYDENTRIYAFMAERGYRDCEIERALVDNAEGENPPFRWVTSAVVDLNTVKTIGDVAEGSSDVYTLRADTRYLHDDTGCGYWEDVPLSDVATLSYGRLERLSSYDKTPLPEREAYTSDFERLVYVPALLSGSDYSGGSVQTANFRVFCDMFKAEKGVTWWELYGGHGTYAVAIALNCHNADMVEFFEGLADYPCASNDELAEVEHEAESEAWENWLRSDFVHELKKRSEDEAWETAVDNASDENLHALLLSLMDQANEYFEHEEGGSVYLRLENLFKNFDMEAAKQSLEN